MSDFRALAHRAGWIYNKAIICLSGEDSGKNLETDLVVRVVVLCAVAGALSGLFVVWFNRDKLRRQQQFIRGYFYAAFIISCLVVVGFIVLLILRWAGIDLFPW